MLEVKCFGHLSIVVPDIEEAQNYYKTLFGIEPVISFKNFKNEGYSKNMGLQEVEVHIRMLRFSHCNLVLELIQFEAPKGSQEISKFKVNDLGGPRCISLHVEDVLKAFKSLKGKAGIEILNSEDYRPVALSSIQSDQFILGAEDNNLEAKDRIVLKLSKKYFFLFRDPYGVIWKIEERLFDHSS